LPIPARVGLILIKHFRAAMIARCAFRVADVRRYIGGSNSDVKKLFRARSW
jgi:hypothetical protein